MYHSQAYVRYGCWVAADARLSKGDDKTALHAPRCDRVCRGPRHVDGAAGQYFNTYIFNTYIILQHFHKMLQYFNTSISNFNT
jgi:hypothetical protein